MQPRSFIFQTTFVEKLCKRCECFMKTEEKVHGKVLSYSVVQCFILICGNVRTSHLPVGRPCAPWRALSFLLVLRSWCSIKFCFNCNLQSYRELWVTVRICYFFIAPIFLDTSFWYGYFIEVDTHHRLSPNLIGNTYASGWSWAKQNQYHVDQTINYHI